MSIIKLVLIFNTLEEDWEDNRAEMCMGSIKAVNGVLRSTYTDQQISVRKKYI